MNKSVKKTLLISLMIVFCILVPFSLWELSEVTVKPIPTPVQLVTDLVEMIDRYKKGEVPEIDISLLTAFTWDRLYVFGAFTNKAKLDSMFGDSWHDKCRVTIEYSDSVALLVFAQNKKVVNCIEYPIYENDFSGLKKYESGFLPEEARFVLNERGNVIWVGDK